MGGLDQSPGLWANSWANGLLPAILLQRFKTCDIFNVMGLHTFPHSSYRYFTLYCYVLCIVLGAIAKITKLKDLFCQARFLFCKTKN